MTKLDGVRKVTAGYLTQSASRLLARTPVTPNVISWVGFLLTAVAAALILTDNLFAGGITVLVAGFFDMLDGALARLTGKVTRFGGVLDSMLDRLDEALLLVALLVVYAREQSVAGTLIAGLTLTGSFMVSYLRARVEALGIDCKVGIFTRPERVIVLALGLLLSRFDYALIAALAVIMLFSFFTTVERLLYVWRRTRND